MSNALRTVAILKEELASVRQRSLRASNQGDFMLVARLTSRAQQLNRQIFDAENGIISPPCKPAAKAPGKPLP